MTENTEHTLYVTSCFLMVCVACAVVFAAVFQIVKAC